MIFELRNKMPRNSSSYLNSEDVLTSTIFGNLRYFNSQKLLIDFLNQSFDIDCKNNIAIQTNAEFAISFWKRFNDGHDEPDLFLSSDNYDIIIECKYHSPLGEKYENDDESNGESEYSNQLTRYSKILEASNKKKIMIFLTNHESIPWNIMWISRKGINENIQLCWLSWKRLYYCLKNENICNYSKGEKALYWDTLDFLEKRNLVAFYGIRSIQQTSCNWRYKRQYKYCTEYDFSWRYCRWKTK